MSAPQSQLAVEVKMQFPARIFTLGAFFKLGFLPKIHFPSQETKLSHFLQVIGKKELTKVK